MAHSPHDLPAITLIPLGADHAPPLQAVYEAAPAYWARFALTHVPSDQAARDLAEAAADPTRTLLGILRRVDAADPAAGQIMVGAIDLRRHYPDDGFVTLGLLVVAESYQRAGIGRAAWTLLEAWLAAQPEFTRARLSVEQFNIPGLHFFTALGFGMTGDANRQKVGDAFVRYLAMEKALNAGK